jgi:hypothetical protein
MKRFMPAFLFLLVFSAAAHAQETRYGVRVGIVDDDPMIGGEVVVPLPAGFVLNPNFEFSTDAFSLNADAHYDFTLTASTDFWIGAGLAFVNPDEGDFEGGFNLLAGIGVRRGGNWYPYGQLKYTSAGDLDDYASAAVGVRF